MTMEALIFSYLEKLQQKKGPPGPVPVAGLVSDGKEGSSVPEIEPEVFHGVPQGYWDGRSLYAVARNGAGAELLRWSSVERESRFGGEMTKASGAVEERLRGESLSAEALWQLLPHLAPSALASVDRTIGTGDRLGLAGHAHASAFTQRDAAPVLAQQSVRELRQTGRGYGDVLLAATLGALEAGYTGPWGFDGDHLKNMEEVEAALAAGCTMLTIDLSGILDLSATTATGSELERSWNRIPGALKERWENTYIGRTHRLTAGVTVYTDPEATKQTLATFWKAFRFLEDITEAIGKSGRRVDLEVSVDETGLDTTIVQHFILVNELTRRGVMITSLAPKFVGEFQKGIDYQGELTALEENIAEHARLAEALGKYKLSIHSGSDKLSVFPLVEKVTRGSYHLKTSGTFWLEAVRTVAQVSPELFRSIFGIAWESFEEMQALYHVTSEKEDIVPLRERPTAEYQNYLGEPASRQLLHVAYGSVLKERELRRELLELLSRNRSVYLENIRAHTDRHLDALKVPRRG